MSERFNVGYCGSMLPQYPPNWLSEINVTFYSVTLAGRYSSLMMVLRAETCRIVFNVLMCKFYKFIYEQWLV